MKVNRPAAVEAETLQIAMRAGQRARQRRAQVRRAFVQRLGADDQSPPLARFIRGGRGGEVRLKVYLTQLWIGSGKGNKISFAASAYARLIGLEEPYKNGARKVNDALDWLHTEGFIKLERTRGREPEVTLRRDDGSRRLYEVPGSAAKDPTTGKIAPEGHYFTVAPSFWTRGWIAYLPAPAVVMLLVLLAQSRSKRKDGIWISPGQLNDLFDVSDDTRRRGIAVLEDVGIVCVGRRAVDPDFEFRRIRNVYSIEPAMLDCQIKTGAISQYTTRIEQPDQTKAQAWSDYVHQCVVDNQQQSPLATDRVARSASADQPRIR